MSRKMIFMLALALILVSISVGCTRNWGNESLVPTVPAIIEATPLPVLPTPTLLPSASPTTTPTDIYTPTPSATPMPTPTPMPVGPSNFPENVNPLTGLVISPTTNLDRHPVMVKVSNFPRGLRPHSGLSFADLVFEYTIGVGATRYTAIYYGLNAPKIGPVRSARLIDASLGTAYQGVLAFAGADSYVYGKVVDALGNRAITEGPLTCPGLCRLPPGDVNSVFVDSEALTTYAVDERDVPDARPNLDGMLFDPKIPVGGEDGSGLEVRYASSAISEWHFDPETGAYLRWIESVDNANNISMVPLVDRETGEQLAFQNVVVMFVEHNELKPTLHEVIMIGNTTGQRAILFRDGQAYEFIWKTVVATKPFQFFTPSGELIAFKPGNTWFQVVGLSSTAEESGDEWKVTLFLP